MIDLVGDDDRKKIGSDGASNGTQATRGSPLAISLS